MLNKNFNLIFFLFVFVLFSFEVFAAGGGAAWRRNFKKMDAICWEIGRTATYPKVCKSPTKVIYKNLVCWGCPEATRCKPACRGGKVCMNQKCVCPPNQFLYDCNGRCLSPGTPCTK